MHSLILFFIPLLRMFFRFLNDKVKFLKKTIMQESWVIIFSSSKNQSDII